MTDTTDPAVISTDVRLEKEVSVRLRADLVGVVQPPYNSPLWPDSLRLRYVRRQDATVWQLEEAEVSGPGVAEDGSQADYVRVTGSWWASPHGGAEHGSMPAVVRRLITTHRPTV
jgi:hypothetical protein